MKQSNFLRICSLTVAILFSGISLADQPLRLLVVGNSITWHTPNAKLGWDGNWGMAASARELDFSHVLASKLSQFQNGQQPILYPRNISDFELNPEGFDFDKLNFVEVFKPDAVVVFLGDNARLNQYDALTYERQYEKLLGALAVNTKSKLYCVSTWWSNKKVDSLISKACLAKRGEFVDINGLSTRPGMKAASTGMYANAGVSAHPSDEGMEAIATKIFSSMKGL